MVLLVLFSFMVLNNYDETFSTVEAVVLIWIFAMGLEELRQVLATAFITRTHVTRLAITELTPVAQIAQHPADWIDDIWNRLDALIISFYFVGFTIRITDLDSSEALLKSKGVHGFVCLLLWMRMARYYTVSETLGPKVDCLHRCCTIASPVGQSLLSIYGGYRVLTRF